MILENMSFDSNILSLGSLLGQTGTPAVIQQINESCGGGSFFGSASDPFREGYKNFISKVVQPIQQIGQTVAATAKGMFLPDVIRPINSMKELERGITPAMHLPIIYYAPIRQMLEEERIQGFGIDPANLEDEDPYESVLNSGVVEVHTSTLNANHAVDVTWTIKTTDPKLTEEEKDAIRETREYIDTFLEDDLTQCLDFTSYPNLHC